jgi:hypothetical protein
MDCGAAIGIIVGRQGAASPLTAGATDDMSGVVSLVGAS